MAIVATVAASAATLPVAEVVAVVVTVGVVVPFVGAVVVVEVVAVVVARVRAGIVHTPEIVSLEVSLAVLSLVSGESVEWFRV